MTDFLDMLNGLVGAQTENVAKRGGGFGAMIERPARDITGVATFISVKENSSGSYRVGIKLVCDAGEFIKDFSWASATWTGSEGSAKYFSRMIAAVRCTASDFAEKYQARYGTAPNPEDSESMVTALGDLFLGKRVRFSVKANDSGYWNAEFISAIDDEKDPAQEFEPSVFSEKDAAPKKAAPIGGAPKAAPAKAPAKGRVAL